MNKSYLKQRKEEISAKLITVESPYGTTDWYTGVTKTTDMRDLLLYADELEKQIERMNILLKLHTRIIAEAQVILTYRSIGKRIKYDALEDAINDLETALK